MVRKKMGNWCLEYHWTRQAIPWLILLSLAAFIAILHVDIPTRQPFFPLKTLQSHLMNNVRSGSEKNDTLMLREVLNQTQIPLSDDSKVEVAEKNSAGLPSKEKKNGRMTNSHSPRIAICLVGGARKFELTGPSLLKYVLNKYNNSDVFLHTPFDKDSHKFSLLKDVSNLAAVRIFTPGRITETDLQAEVLTASGSPNGLQGLLQYFNLVEGCLTMIKGFQSKHNLKYDWVVRTRVDGYWSGPLPPPQTFSPKYYIVPPGSQYGGLNDRLGIGNLATSEVALSRISLIPLLYRSGYRGLNSETAFKNQLEVKGVEYRFRSFPFCILSERRYDWPPSRWGVPVASLSSKGHLNGAKCRPCKSVSKGSEAKNIIQTLVRSWSWTLAPDGLELCNAHDGWEEHWEDIFDRVAGAELSAARKKIQFHSVSDCIKDFEAMKRKAGSWESPSPATICEKVSRSH